MQGTLLVKRVTQESDEEMEDEEGSRKRKAVCQANSSVKASEFCRWEFKECLAVNWVLWGAGY